MIKLNRFTVVFLLMLIIPLIAADKKGGIISRRENRYLAARPPLTLLFENPGLFCRRIDGWFSDNLGFRENFIDLYKKFRLTDQNQYTEGQSIILTGEEGHNYFAYTDGWMIKKFQGRQFLTDDQLEEMANGLNRISDYLENENIPCIVMFCADKETIYPEFYPKSIIRGPEPVQLEVISNYVRDNTNIDFFNIMDCLLAAKKDYPVFDKKGDGAEILSHFNETGAFFSYRELMKHIARYLEDMEPLTTDDITITYGYKNGYPDIPFISIKQGMEIKILDQDFFSDLESVQPAEGVALENTGTKSSKKILLMRDSYAGRGTLLSNYIPQHFRHTIMFHYRNTEYLRELVDIYKPDIVVFESAERQLELFCDSIMKFR